MDDLAARKRELYRAYDEAALRILMDRYGDVQGEKLLEELLALPAEERAVPAGEERAVSDALERCAKRKRASVRSRAALRTFGKVAVVLLVLGSLSGYAAFTASANHERQANREESNWSVPDTQSGEDVEQEPDGEKREDQRDEVWKTAD